MQRFIQIVSESTESHIENFNRIEKLMYDELQTSGSTRLVINLQKMQWERAIFAIGIFSLFEAVVQNQLEIEKGSAFKELKEKLKRNDKTELLIKFEEFYYAINVLKHGKGSSYTKLLEKQSSLPFEITPAGSVFRNEGDVSEIETLIYVDDEFLKSCLAVICQCYDELFRI
ncbi:hypothetical protein [Psychrobacter sp. M13]|uniref:hypothetical protein n=1 Tax=Psychrobacter sp. M13 TaxID=3067275 RepID=UPI00273B607C|nr:hypothetical protein [Psychrobacter sp. M13]WLP93820.1 hypothetical protein Q9G97_09490 [Psychrobacter sp. M13]